MLSRELSFGQMDYKQLLAQILCILWTKKRKGLSSLELESTYLLFAETIHIMQIWRGIIDAERYTQASEHTVGFINIWTMTQRL